MQGPKVLILDIETAPILASVWGIWDQNVPLNMIKSDWHLLSWAAKWLGDPPSKIMYQDQRGAKNVEDDSNILKGIWRLVNEADVIIWQNGDRFDGKKLNSRFILNGMKPPSSYKTVDTLKLAKSNFAFTSNKLEYMSEKLCTKYKKLKIRKFRGFDLWKECLAGNLSAWKEMEEYNKYDVLATEELYTELAPWAKGLNFNAYTDEETRRCTCGGSKLAKNGFTYSSLGKYQRYQCVKCGAEFKDRANLLTKVKRQSI